ncbi:MAG TPA: cupredoxin domain-containing protein [Verrucomicrobiae bacterium]|jgi:plastocyanin|nr:cupredoxin domain-containing protein [Verrucomicrobiae bacterium]
MNKKMIIIAVVIALVVIGSAATAYVISQNAGAPSNKPASESSSQATATITYSDSGFSPSLTTVKAGDTVAIKNTSSGDLQFDSDPHPVHTDDTELNVGTVAPGQTATFTVTTKGTFGFHNHLNPGDKASITIQ